MQAILERADRFLDKELDLKERALVVVAALMLAAVYLFPLWNLTMFAPQYPDGLRMDIYSYKLEGGNHGQDVKEINLLNHYIGMKDLVAEDFTEFKWMPFVVGAIGLLFLRTAVHGRMASLLDVIVLYGYFAAFSLWSFALQAVQLRPQPRADGGGEGRRPSCRRCSASSSSRTSRSTRTRRPASYALGAVARAARGGVLARVARQAGAAAAVAGSSSACWPGRSSCSRSRRRRRPTWPPPRRPRSKGAPLRPTRRRCRR